VKRPPDPDPAAVVDALARMEELVGGPQDTDGASKDTLLNEIMAKAAKGLSRSCGEKLNQLVLCLIDQPDYRLAGAEEALKQLSDLIDKVIEHHESLARELAEQAVEAHARVHLLLGQIRANPGSRRNAPLIAELGDTLLLFPRCRYQSLTLRQMIQISISLRGGLSEQVREIHFVRNRLTELVRAFEGREAPGRSSDPAPGMCLLPSGCRSVADATQRLQESLTPPDIKDLDQRIQALVTEQYTSLVNVCLASGNLIDGLRQLMLQQAEAFAGGRLVGTSVGEMFLTQFADEKRALQAIEKAFAQTVPELGDSTAEPATEVRILALPPGPAAEQYRGLVQRALPGTELEVTESADDIVFYRELPHVPLAQLKVLGQAGQEAYRQMNSTEHFPPHARADITDWQEVR
jgi:hypothetical protein